MTIADIVRPFGNVVSAFSVWSTSPPKTSRPPNANIANVRNDKILRGVWYAGFGEVVKSLAIFNIGCLNWNPFEAKTTSPPINNTKLSNATAVPPTEVTLVIFSTPFEAINVTSNIHRHPSIPSDCIELKPNKLKDPVLSLPNIALAVSYTHLTLPTKLEV